MCPENTDKHVNTNSIFFGLLQFIQSKAFQNCKMNRHFMTINSYALKTRLLLKQEYPIHHH